jgi:hypothetical protein
MSTSTRALLIAAGVILLLFAVGFHFGFRSNVKEPLTHAMELDTASVVQIRFEDRADRRNDLVLARTPAGWQWMEGDTTQWSADTLADELLLTFGNLRIKRTMGMIRLLAERYQLTDSSLARITFTDPEGNVNALDIGSNTFAPGKIGAWTYVRIPGEPEVYAVEGLLAQRLRRVER